MGSSCSFEAKSGGQDTTTWWSYHNDCIDMNTSHESHIIIMHSEPRANNHEALP